MDSLASRYASALLSLALENNANSEYRLAVKDIVNTFEGSPELLSLLRSSFISNEEKKKVITSIFEGEPYPYIRDFILVIIDNARANQLIPILKEFIRLSNNEDNIIEGIVYSTFKLSKEEMAGITSSIETKLNKKIYLYNRIDSSLIGGIKVIVDDFVFDGSIKDKLRKLKSKLVEGV